MAAESELHRWLNEYGTSHQNPINIIIHKICVPTIAFTVLGFLWSVPLPKFIRQSGGNIFSHLLPMLFMGPIFHFYFQLSTKMAFTMLFFVLCAIAILAKMEEKHLPIFLLSLIVFVLAWIGQFIGHSIEGKRPSFFDDVKFFAVGPLWTLSSAFRAFNIDY